MIEVELTKSEPDIEVKAGEAGVLDAKVYVWNKDAGTVRVTIFIGGESRMFDATAKRGIRERRD